VGNLEFGWKLKAANGTGDDIKSLMVSVFERCGEQELHSEADAEKGAIGGNVVSEHIHKVMLVECSDGVAKGTDTGENDAGGAGECGG
jgi:hypothetical protein